MVLVGSRRARFPAKQIRIVLLRAAESFPIGLILAILDGPDKGVGFVL
jgi:hypothetical protein